MPLVRQRGWEALDVPEFPKARFQAPPPPHLRMSVIIVSGPSLLFKPDRVSHNASSPSGTRPSGVEAVVYVTVYVPDASDWFLTYRFTIPLLLHATASFIVGLGINESLLAWAKGGSPFPKATRKPKGVPS